MRTGSGPKTTDRRARGAALAGAVAMAAMLAAASPAMAAGGEGGGANGCPYAQDVEVRLGGATIMVPQNVFDPRSSNRHLDGYDLVPMADQLRLRFIGPHGEIYESALTHIRHGKRCTAFYIAQPFLISGPIQYKSATRPAVR